MYNWQGIGPKRKMYPNHLVARRPNTSESITFGGGKVKANYLNQVAKVGEEFERDYNFS